MRSGPGATARLSVLGPRALVLLGVLSAAPAAAFEFPAEQEASAERLLDIWREQTASFAKGRPDRVAIQVFERRIFPPVRGIGALAYIRFQPLDAAGTAQGWNAANCTDATRVGSGVQIVLTWDAGTRRWDQMNSIGSALCASDKDLSPAQIQEALTLKPYPKPPKLAAGEVMTPPPGSPERKAILDAVRGQFGRQAHRIVFEVRTMNVAAGFAWVTVMPLYASGKRVGCIEGDDLQSEFWLKREHGRWTVASGSACAGDPAASLGEMIGAPPELIGQSTWPWAPDQP